MRALVTGAAGFIGSTLVDRLLVEGHDVVGVDSMSPYYDRNEKWSHLDAACRSDRFRFVEADLVVTDLAPLLDGVDWVFHLAGQPGVRASWGSSFDGYLRDNVLATQNLLEAAREHPLERFVFSSSSSVYGAAERFPTHESDLPRPMSPYGVTKLAAEHLCLLYARSYGVPVVSLRYFTVYGPRQRPDMAIRRLIDAALCGGTFPLNGDGSQVRDFTFVDDVVAANLLAATEPGVPSGSVYNVAGGTQASMKDVIAIVEALTGTTVALDRRPGAVGEPARTAGATEQAARVLGWKPAVTLEEGLARHVASRRPA